VSFIYWRSILGLFERDEPVNEDHPLPVQIITPASSQYLTDRMVADKLVKSGAGMLHTITFSQADAAPTAGTITVYDSLTETGTVLFIHTQTTAVFMPVSVTLDVPYSIGLYVGFATTADVSVTVSYL
jgi:hypothetical protein